jgi:RNA polymerase sigma-70 factor, ECF subfamily
MQETDALLCRRAQAGDRDAFGLLFERHSKDLYNFCFRRVGDWSVAEDLLSIVFMTAWRCRAKAPPEQLLPWLYGIGTNVVRNQYRGERRFRTALQRVIDSSQTDNRADPELGARLEDERTMQSLLRLLSALPRREQDVFVLCAWAELSYEDTALALGIPIGTVRSRLSRARTRLRELEPDFGHIDSRNPILPEGGSHEY